MIYVRLYGGLGNQLFQYATARSVARTRGVEVGLDRRYLTGGPAHLAYALHPFAVHADIDPVCLPPYKGTALGRYLLWRCHLWPGPHFTRERGLGVNPEILVAEDDTYLHGYFQSERYFADHVEGLREELRIVTPPKGQNAEWIDRIGADERAVSVHLRRGDYLQGRKTTGTHASCDEAYYRSALRQVSERTGLEVRAYVFSDDPQWAQDNLALGVETVILGHNGILDAHEDLRLMALCRHHVIANSTFSWWGAWLDARSGSVTVAPKRWFANGQLSNPDILPDRWVAV